METLVIGISVMLLVYAFFLYITFYYFLGDRDAKAYISQRLYKKDKRVCGKLRQLW